MRTILGIIIGIIGLIAVGAAAYYVWQYISEVIISPPQPIPPPSVQTPAERLSEATLKNYFVQGDKVVGIQTDGLVVEIQNKKAAVINTSKIDNLNDASFSYDGKKILAKFGTWRNPLFSIFDKDSNQWTAFSNINIISAAWSPDTQEIAYVEEIDGKTNLGILNAGDPKLSRKTLATISQIDSEVFWLNKNEILINSKPSQFVNGYILKYKIKERQFEPIVYEEAGVMVNWDAEKNRGLKLYYAAGKNNLALIDAAGKIVTGLNFLTLPDKCAFKNDSLYCAIPRNMPPRPTLPDDYLKQALFFADDFFKVNLVDGKVERLLKDNEMPFDAVRLKINNNKLLFINRLDEKLYQFSI